MNGERKTIPAVRRDVVIIGGGPAGLAAAVAAKEAGCGDVLLISGTAFSAAS